MQMRLFDPSKVMSTQFSPSEAASSGAEAYGTGWKQPKDQSRREVLQRGHATFLAYRDAMGQEPSAKTMAGYDAMRQHTAKQYEHLTKPTSKGGMGISVEVTDTDPYDSPQSMAQDFNENKRIKVMSTKTTGGHSVLSDEDNDKFRAVHDVFGHLATGKGFSRYGEDDAYRSHAQMYPKEARPALAGELRGQNAYLNYSPEGDFPPNAAVNLPDWVGSGGKVPYRNPYDGSSKRPKLRKPGEQLSLF